MTMVSLESIMLRITLSFGPALIAVFSIIVFALGMLIVLEGDILLGNLCQILGLCCFAICAWFTFIEPLRNEKNPASRGFGISAILVSAACFCFMGLLAYVGAQITFTLSPMLYMFGMCSGFIVSAYLFKKK